MRRSNTSIQGGMRDRGRTWLKHASCEEWSHPPWSPSPSQQRMRELGMGQTRPDISLCDERSYARNGLQPWIHSSASKDEVTYMA